MLLLAAFWDANCTSDFLFSNPPPHRSYSHRSRQTRTLHFPPLHFLGILTIQCLQCFSFYLSCSESSFNYYLGLLYPLSPFRIQKCSSLINLTESCRNCLTESPLSHSLQAFWKDRCPLFFTSHLPFIFHHICSYSFETVPARATNKFLIRRSNCRLFYTLYLT